MELGSTPTDKTPDNICEAMDELGTINDTTAPTLTLTSPTGTTSTKPEKAISILSIKGIIMDQSRTTIIADVYSSDGKTLINSYFYYYKGSSIGFITSFVLDVPLEEKDKTYQIKLYATDNKGNKSKTTYTIYTINKYALRMQCTNGTGSFLYGKSGSGFVNIATISDSEGDLFSQDKNNKSIICNRNCNDVTIKATTKWNKHYDHTGTAYCKIYKNGEEIASANENVKSDAVTIECITTISLLAGDYIQLYYTTSATLQGYNGILSLGTDEINN